MPLFSRPPPKSKSKEKQHISSLKNDRSLFSRLYVASQIRDGDIDTFFRHENQAYPPSLSQFGRMRTGTKSDLVKCLEDQHLTNEFGTSVPHADVIILDGAAIVHLLSPCQSKTFSDYAHDRFIPYIENQLKGAERVDIIWDQYVENSLKATARERRGTGSRRRVESNACVPKNGKISSK